MVSESTVIKAKISPIPSWRRADFNGESSAHPNTLWRTWLKAALACGRDKTMVHSKEWRWYLGWSLKLDEELVVELDKMLNLVGRT